MLNYSTEVPSLLLAAVCEELFFRGVVFSELMERVRVKPLTAAVIVSGLFAGLHLFNLNSYASPGYAFVQIIFAFSISLVLSYLYLYKGIWPCIAVHGLINWASTFNEKFNEKGQLILTNTETAVYLFLALFFLYAGIKMLKKLRD